jgi:peptidase M23-like protein
MMRFRLHSVIAVFSAILFLPVLGRTQQQNAAPAQQTPSGAQQMPNSPQQKSRTAEDKSLQEKTAEAPIQPIMSGPYPVMSPAARERGRQIFEMFAHTRSSEMWASLSEGLRKMSGKEEKFVEVNKKLREKMGNETQMVEENMVPYLYAPDTVYSRLSVFEHVRLPVMSIITFNQRGQIDAFDIKPVYSIAEGRYAGYQDTAKLKLPFKGEWLVYHGGRNYFENPYAALDDTRFALDFVYLQDNRLFSGPGLGSKNQDYYCWGQPVLAAADGTVVRAISGFDDNPPGKPSGDSPDGNIVVISHGNGETSTVNHLKQNSVKVKVDDKVKQGDVIAECGNSGAGGVPHIHYQFGKGRSVGLPATFVDYIADGKPVASGEPKRGQLVKNGSESPSTSGTSSAMSGSSMPAKEASPANSGNAGTATKPPATSSK